MKQNIKQTVLENGITILTDYMPHAYSAAVGVWVPRGSRHEAHDEFGLSHFYEHLVFKGTENRTALEIAHAIRTPSKTAAGISKRTRHARKRAFTHKSKAATCHLPLT